FAATVTIPSTTATATVVILMYPAAWWASHRTWTGYFWSFSFAKHFTGNWLYSGDRSLFQRRLWCRRNDQRWTYRSGGRLDAATFLQFSDFVFNSRNNFFVFFGVFKEIRNVEEGVAVEANVDKGGLHAG